LDEIGEMDIDLQAKLLRVIEEKTVQRLGSVRTTPINVRIISTTNKNFESLIQANKFREDLFYRLNVIPIHLPPLRERKEDIPVLVRHFVATYGAGKNIEFPERTMTMLQHYHWPGNVRELRNLVERITLLSDAAVIEPEDLQQYLQMTNAAESKALPSNISVLTPRPTSLLNNVGHDRIAVESLPNDDIFTTMIDQGLSLYDVQREMIRAALKLSAGNRSKAALILRVPRYKLIYMEKKMTLLSEEP
jgi:two-component system NtrC family response regulator